MEAYGGLGKPGAKQKMTALLFVPLSDVLGGCNNRYNWENRGLPPYSIAVTYILEWVQHSANASGTLARSLRIPLESLPERVHSPMQPGSDIAVILLRQHLAGHAAKMPSRKSQIPQVHTGNLIQRWNLKGTTSFLRTSSSFRFPCENFVTLKEMSLAEHCPQPKLPQPCPSCVAFPDKLIMPLVLMNPSRQFASWSG